MPPHILSALVFAPGQPPGQEDTIILPLLQKQKILHAISIGPASQNMSEFHHNGTTQEINERQEKFLSKNGLAPLSKACISIKPNPQQPIVVDITPEYLNTISGPIIIEAESIFTTIPGIPLIHRPADCPTAVITSKNKNGGQIIGIAHLGRPQINDRVTEATLEHLFNHYEVNPRETMVGIAPSIGPAHYFIKVKDQEKNNFLDLKYWGDSAHQDEIESEQVIRVDVLGRIVAILLDKGIPEENIEAYDHSENVDTYTLAAKNPPEAYSYRYSVAMQQPERNGRIMVAAQIPQG